MDSNLSWMSLKPTTLSTSVVLCSALLTSFGLFYLTWCHSNSSFFFSPSLRLCPTSCLSRLHLTVGQSSKCFHISSSLPLCPYHVLITLGRSSSTGTRTHAATSKSLSPSLAVQFDLLRVCLHIPPGKLVVVVCASSLVVSASSVHRRTSYHLRWTTRYTRRWRGRGERESVTSIWLVSMPHTHTHTRTLGRCIACPPSFRYSSLPPSPLPTSFSSISLCGNKSYLRVGGREGERVPTTPDNEVRGVEANLYPQQPKRMLW